MGRQARSGSADRSRPRRRAHDDAGFTLTEIVMAIVIMSIIVAPTLTAVITAVRADSQNNSLAEVQTVLQNAADRVNRAPKSCDYTIYAQAAAQTEGWVSTTTTVVQQHYTPGVTPDVAGVWSTGACVGTTPTTLLVQLVNITVKSPDGKVSKSLQVVKSDV